MTMIQVFLSIVSGIIVGFVLGLLGGGGSILVVPLLLYVVGMKDPHVVIGTTASAVAIKSIHTYEPAQCAVESDNHFCRTRCHECAYYGTACRFSAITCQTVVLSFSFADGLGNIIFPTGGTLMAGLAIAGMPWIK
jgi:hypothetical protein